MAEDSKNLKFLMVLNNIDWFWSHRLPLADAIQKRGWKLCVATHGADKDQGLLERGVKGVPLSDHKSAFDLIAFIRICRSIARVIQDEKPDILHAITIRYAFYAGLAARFIGYKPSVFTIAGLGNLYTAPGIKYRFLRAVILPIFRFVFGGKDTRIIFQNHDDQKKMVDANIVNKNHTVVIRGSGVDITEFTYTPYQEKDQKPVILFASRLLMEKGIYDFIEAAIILQGRGVQARFVVAGDVYDHNPRSIPRNQIQDYHDDGIIEWVGRHDDMPTLITESMMMVLPSYYGEGVPKVLLEAAAMGRPIITCDSPGCREAVAHDVNGVLVPPQSPETLADEIEALIGDPERRARYGQAGRTRVEEDFHTDAVVAQTMAVYDALLNAHEQPNQNGHDTPLDRAA